MAGTYDTGLVLLSVFIAIAASYVALDLGAKVTSTQGASARAWLVGGAFAMGAGIWSMHFVGMLAFALPTRMAYDPWLTLLSLVIAVVTSGFALAVVGRLAIDSAAKVDPSVLVAGGVLMGAGICGMHYTGMAAMLMSPPIEYSPLLFGASMLIAVCASIAALGLAFTFSNEAPERRVAGRALAAVAMGLGISGMHYTAMAAARFEPGAICAVSSRFDVDNGALAYGVTSGVLLILVLTLLASALKVQSNPGADLDR